MTTLPSPDMPQQGQKEESTPPAPTPEGGLTQAFTERLADAATTLEEAPETPEDREYLDFLRDDILRSCAEGSTREENLVDNPKEIVLFLSSLERNTEGLSPSGLAQAKAMIREVLPNCLEKRPDLAWENESKIRKLYPDFDLSPYINVLASEEGFKNPKNLRAALTRGVDSVLGQTYTTVEAEQIRVEARKYIRLVEEKGLGRQMAEAAIPLFEEAFNHREKPNDDSLMLTLLGLRADDIILTLLEETASVEVNSTKRARRIAEVIEQRAKRMGDMFSGMIAWNKFGEIPLAWGDHCRAIDQYKAIFHFHENADINGAIDRLKAAIDRAYKVVWEEYGDVIISDAKTYEINGQDYRSRRVDIANLMPESLDPEKKVEYEAMIRNSSIAPKRLIFSGSKQFLSWLGERHLTASMGNETVTIMADVRTSDVTEAVKAKIAELNKTIAASENDTAWIQKQRHRLGLLLQLFPEQE